MHPLHRRRHIAAVALVLAAVAATRCDGVDLRHSRQTSEEEQGEWKGFDFQARVKSDVSLVISCNTTISEALYWMNFNPIQL